MWNLKRSLAGALALALPLAFAPDGLNAQEREIEREVERECTAEVVPRAVQAGHPAVQILLAPSGVIGPVNELEAPEESGLAVASPDDLPRSQMANEEQHERPRPIEPTEEGNTLTVWLNTEEATPGTHQIKLEGENSACTAEVTVANPGGTG